MYSGWITVRVRGVLAAGVVAVVALVLGVAVGVSSARAAGAPCPNEALRAESSLAPETHLPLSMQLPECRAYELVSPPFTEGYPILGDTAISSAGVVAISGDGSRAIAVSLGAFAGSASDTGFGAFYELTRGGSGWVASPLAPSPTRFPYQRFLAVSEDLSSSAWAVREPSQSINAQELYLREPDGSFVKVGPLISPSVASGPAAGDYDGVAAEAQFAGASSDLSDVLFTIATQGKYWPFDTTIQTTAPPSLYEYTGTGDSEPALVGVSGGAGSHTLISQCGTSLGGEHSYDTYNGVSNSGATVYFTAEHKSTASCPGGAQPAVDELYARIDGSETVAISEPTSAQCADCSTGARGAAEFQGASADGSKAFFTTAQELLPGQTGTNLYEYDFDNLPGEKVVLVSRGAANPEVQGMARVSVDGSHVYFVAKGVLTNEPDLSLAAGHQSAVAGADNLYVFERDARYPDGHVSFVAALSPSDAADWRAEDGRPVQVNQCQSTEAGCEAGRFLVFPSSEDLTAGDTSTVSQLFEYDALRGELVRVSVGQRAAEGYECPVTHVVEEGYNCDGNTDRDSVEIPAPGYTVSSAPSSTESTMALSNDGAYVFFTSSDGLTPLAQFTSNHVINIFGGREVLARNVYEYHSAVGAGGAIGEGDVYLISDGRDLTLRGDETSGVQLYGSDASGGDVFFSSGDQLVGQDTDTQVNVYDARVDGGFPAPVSPVECAGEGCLPGSSAPPPFGSATSSSVAGGGNLIPPPVVSPRVVEAKTKPKLLTRAQKLANALRACKKEPRKQRAACRARAEKRFGGKAKAKKSGNGGGR
jgi:hypothetical protein